MNPVRWARRNTAWRAAAVSLAAGLVMGAVYELLGVVSPAPPLLGLTGLLGIVLGERGASAWRDRRAHRRVDARRPPAPRDAAHPAGPAPSRSTPPGESA
ncbi:DUF1427 family protein [Streptomyces nitrosporeus]|nr:DUF1427 family protein [Streptomyces nitrosporeus]GGZ24030.1 hypothetical protein GCM10010327_63570 [Streptomyces nitrosporeus]